jgi:hypothetical protein
VCSSDLTFNVVAENTFSASDKSADVYLVSDPAAIIEPVGNLRVLEVNQSSVSIAWNAVGNVSGYAVVTKSSNYFATYPLINTTETSCNITGLSPHTRYSFDVSALRHQFTGPAVPVVATTTGEQLPIVAGLQAHIVKGEMTAVKLEWEVSQDKRKAKWEYGIFYGANLKEMYLEGVRYRTTETTFTVRNLDACESYIFDVALIGPLGFGPGSARRVSITTEFDHRSPPKNVQVQLSPRNVSDAVISWSPPCAVLTTDLGYLITVRDQTMKKVSHISLNPSKNTTLLLHLEVHFGANYEVSIQIDQANSRTYGPVAISGPPIPPPHQLSVGREHNGSLVLYWRDQDLPPEIASHNYSYTVWLSKDHTFSDQSTRRYSTYQRTFQVPSDHPGELYYAAVSILESHGYESLRSDPLDMLFILADEIPPQVAESSSHVYVAVTVAVVIAVALGASLLVLLIRHRRLQRSFVSFANSHYDTRSEAATFSDQNLEEEDSPVIRGFSDDEPLVIA